MAAVGGFAGAEEALSTELDAILGPEEAEEQDDGDDLPLEEEAPEEPTEEAEDDEGEAEESAPEAIPAPHSWSKEDKELFAALPTEAQAVIARREKERDTFLNTKAREAANTRATVENEARDVIGKLYANHAQTLSELSRQLVPQAPDESLLYTGNPDDITQYHRQNAAYQRAASQQQELHQAIAQAQAAEQSAMEQSQRAAIAEDAQRLRDELPEWFDEAAGPALQRDLQAIGAELGYSPEVMKDANSSDILALNTALGWKRDAAKYRELIGKKMETVRAAKDLPKMVKPGVKASKTQMNATNSQKAWSRVKANPKDGAAIADWLGLS